MADTAQNRNSALSFSSFVLPIPDGTIDDGDRQTINSVYRGIASGIHIILPIKGPLRRLSIKMGIGL